MRSRLPGPRPSVRRSQRARWQREQRQQRWLVLTAVVVLFVILAIPAYGYYATFVAPPRRMVASVNGVKHSLGEMVKLARAYSLTGAAVGMTPQLGTLPFDILNLLIDSEIIRQAAPTLGVSVTQAEVDDYTRRQFSPQPPPGQQTDPAALDREFRERYRQYLNLSKVSEAEHQDLARRIVLRDKARDVLSAEIPSVAEQVNVQRIRFTDQQKAEEAQKRLKAGEDFARLARIYSESDQYADFDGVVGWVPKGAFPDLDETIFSLKHNEPSDLINLGQEMFIVKVTDGPKTLEINEKMRDLLKTRNLDRWLQEQRKKNDVQVKFGSEEYAWVVDQVRAILPTTPTPTGGQPGQGP